MKTYHKIIIGDALEELKKIPDESIDLVFADPPYNMSKKKGLSWKYSKHVTMQEQWDIFTKDDKDILKKHDEVIAVVTKYIDDFKFSLAGEKLYDYFWHTFADKYIEATKNQLDDDNIKENNRQNIRRVSKFYFRNK